MTISCTDPMILQAKSFTYPIDYETIYRLAVY